MKAVFANGVLSAFEEHGHTGFDALYGTSAGGALAAWFAARQARFAEGTWRYARDRRILSYGRMLRGGPLLDHDALLDIVYRREMPLDVEALRKHPSPVVVTASDIDTGGLVTQDIRHEDPIPWLRATGRLPLFSGPPVQIGSRRLIDGGNIEPIPIHRAIAAGHRHILAILNTAPGERRRDSGAVLRAAASRYPALRAGIMGHEARKDAAIALCMDPPDGVRVDVIRPEDAGGVHRLERNLERLNAHLARGRAAGRAYLEGV